MQGQHRTGGALWNQWPIRNCMAPCTFFQNIFQLLWLTLAAGASETTDISLREAFLRRELCCLDSHVCIIQPA